MSRPPEPTPAGAPTPAWRARLDQYWLLIRGDRPVGILLLLWPTWWALWLAAEGLPPWHLLLIFSAGVWLTRSAGCVINDYADRWLDPQVERTRQRPLATGAVSPREALALFVVMMLVAFGLVLFTNTLTILLSIAGAFLAYCLFGQHLPAPLNHRGYDFSQVIDHMTFGTEGVYGIALGVSAGTIFVYVLFGALLDRAGGGNYMMQVSFAALGHLRG